MLDFYKFIFRRFDKQEKILFILTALTTIVSNAIFIVVPYIQKRLIEQISLEYLEYKDILYLFFISISGIIILLIEAIITNILFRNLMRKMQEELIMSALREKNDIIESKGAGAYIVSVFGDTEQIATVLFQNVFNIIFKIIAVVIILFITYSWSPVFVIIVIPTYIVMILIHIYVDNAYIKHFKKGREYVYEVNPKVLEFIENRSSILGFADIQHYNYILGTLFDKRDDEFKKSMVINATGSMLINGVQSVSLMLFFVASLFLILKNQMSISSFVAMISYFSSVFLPISLIKDYRSNIHKYETVKKKIESSLKCEYKFALPKKQKLELINCTFSYDETKKIKTMDKISFDINQKIAIVGLSGEGKSTIIKTILGELIIEEGECRYGTVSVNEISKYILRTAIRYYSQDMELFDESVEFNITLGKKGISKNEYEIRKRETIDLLNCCFVKIINGVSCFEYSTDEKNILKEILLLQENIFNDMEWMDTIKNCLLCDEMERLQMSDMIGGLVVSRHYYVKEKYNEIICNLHLDKIGNRRIGQRGEKVSGGEKNKIALARFLLPEDSKFYILDEPFTNLDILAQEECMDVLKKYCSDLNGILISHKLDVVREFSDTIVVIECGKITQEGKHNDLIRKEGLYKKLYDEYINNT